MTYRFHRLSVWAGIMSIAAAAAALLAGCNRGEGEKAKAQQAAMMQRPPAAVTAAPALTRDVPVYLDQIGKTLAVESVAIVPQVGGKVTARHVEDGAFVTRGQLLFEIDARPFEAALAAAKATLEQSKAELILAQADWKRVEDLRPQGVISELEYDQKKSALGVAQAKIDAGEAAVRTAELNVEYTKIFSPIDGRAGARLVDPGNIVKANEGTMLIVQRLDPIYAEFTVTENDLGTVRKFMASRGMEVGKEDSLGLKVLVDVPGDSKQLLSALRNPAPSTAPSSTQPAKSHGGTREGTLTFLDNTVQSNTGNVRLRATVTNPDRYLWPGQFVNVRLVLTTKKDAVLVPAEAQQIGQQGPYVYVVKPDQTAEIRPIVPGQRQGELLVIEKGVEPGEMVISSGQMSVMPGGKVMVTNQSQKLEARNSKSETNPNEAKADMTKTDGSEI